MIDDLTDHAAFCDGHAATCDATQPAQDQCCHCYAATTAIAPAPLTTDYVEQGEPVCAKCLTLRDCDTCNAKQQWPCYVLRHYPREGVSSCPVCVARVERSR